MTGIRPAHRHDMEPGPTPQPSTAEWIMEAKNISKEGKDFTIFKNRVGNFNVKGKKLLIPEMNPLSSHLIAGVFRSHDVPAQVMETYEGLKLGKQFTSGKECFPCQITLGDILHHLTREKERLGSRFDPEQYVYFMPEANGPCRFGMYNKLQRIVLDSLGEFGEVRIASLSTEDAYTIGDLIDQDRSRNFRKAAYCAVVIGDVIERTLWRTRPYERSQGSVDTLIRQGHGHLIELFERHSRNLRFEPIFRAMDEILYGAGRLVDSAVPQRPLIGVIGEIYVRTHVRSNQDLIRLLERYNGEAVNASLSEWINYTTYDKIRDEKKAVSYYLRRMDFPNLSARFRSLATLAGDGFYQNFRHRQLFRRARKILDIRPDHSIRRLDKRLEQSGHFSFDIGGETCLSVSGAIECMNHGYNGVVNVFPFTCMPSTATSAVLKPLCSKWNFPYMDAPYDGTIQPGREAAIRTFMHQATQHQTRQQRKETAGRSH